MTIIGRRACPWCGFDHAHVKQNEGKLPYHHCPECGMMTPAKNGLQAALLQRGMRPVDGKVPEPPHADHPIIVPAPSPAPAAAPPPPPAPSKPMGLWDQLMTKGGK